MSTLFFVISALVLIANSSIDASSATTETTKTSRMRINCGSAIKLKHNRSPNFYLNSGLFKWGAGSGQQIVTLKTSKNSSSSLWQVQSPHGMPACEAGFTPIRCGDTIRLLHIDTKKRLHSHPDIPSVLTKAQEVSAFGNNAGENKLDGGDGDHSDDWRVLCSDHYWILGEDFRLEHVATSKYLSSASSHKFTKYNCPQCPVIGELEVSATAKSIDHNNMFCTDQGIHIFK